ncbi:complement C1q-like protein 2 [Mercenaria mercenaria]|uniref:complement C1q-like protein 2 n=1 Tax=Mercenaria mercenaria TaxID=6596 RepID=UPI00234F2909|nr:complement C1q-like protein 2 [Mercenaria mercenaria]
MLSFLMVKEQLRSKMVFLLLLYMTWITSVESNQKNRHFGDIGRVPADNEPIIRELIKRVEVLEARDVTHTQVLEELEKKHRKEIDELKLELANQKHEITILRKKSAGRSRLIAILMRRTKPCVESCVTGSEETGSDIQNLSDESKVNRIRRSMNEAKIAFTAGLTHTFSHAGAHQNIVFDHVETNTGNGYNPHNGVFTAPVSGLYLFYTSVLADNNREVWCQVVVNGKNKGSAYARGTDGRHDQGSQAIIVQLQQGDDVAVQNVAADDAIYGSDGIYSTFSGFLLQQDYSQNIVG